MNIRVKLNLLVTLCSIVANCIPVEQFFPFRGAAGDVMLEDYFSDPISLSPSFPLFGEHMTSLRVRLITAIA